MTLVYQPNLLEYFFFKLKTDMEYPKQTRRKVTLAIRFPEKQIEIPIQ